MKIKLRKHLIQLWIVLGLVVLNDVTVSAQQKNIFFNNYSSRNGLSDNNVTSIVQDDEGYLWVGTKNGLNRFDGYEFKNYKKPIDGKNGISNNYITRLFTDSRKRLWVLTFTGVVLYDKQHDSFTSFGRLFPEKTVQTSGMAEDAGHNLWFSTVGDGIYKLSADLKTTENFLPGGAGDKKNSVSQIVIGKNGDLWLASYDGLLQFNIASKSFTAFPFKGTDTVNRKFNSLFMNLYADPVDENILWCCTWGAGLLRFDIAHREFTQFKYDYTKPVNLCNIVYQCVAKEKNELWLGTEKGLMIYNTESKAFVIYAHEPEEEHSFGGSSSFCLFSGADGKVWFGSASGFSLMNPVKQIFSYKEYPEIGSIGLYEEDTANNISYMVTVYGHRSLWMVNNLTGAKKNFPLPQADEFNAEPCCLLAYNDSLFIGTTKGLYLFNKRTEKIQLLDIASAFGSDKNHLCIYDMTSDGNRNIYIACNNSTSGLLKLNSQKKLSAESITQLSAAPSFANIINFKKDSNGNIWMVSENALVKMNATTNHFDFFNATVNKKYKALSRITDFTFDYKGNIWLSTEGNGILLFDTTFNLTVFNIFNGNPIEFLSSICCDKKNNIWVNGAQGILQFNPSNFTFRHFTTADGLPFDFSLTNLQSFTFDKISFAFVSRIYSFNPFIEQTHAPDYSLKINSLKIFDKNYEGESEINFLDEIKLNHNQNFISFDFSAIDFSNAAAVQYAYRLEGYDDDWNNCGRRRYASYTNLLPGNYKLHIKAGNEQGEWSKHEKMLSIIIEPAVWQTVWFRTVSLLLIVVGIFFIVRYMSTVTLRRQIVQLEKQQAIEKVRAHIARDIHDEIGAGLTKISLMSRQLLKSETGNKNTASKINETSGNLIQNLSEIVWTVNPANDTLENLIAYTRHYCGSFFDNTAIHLHLDLPELNSIPPALMISPDVKRNYLFILKEACNNVLKHSEAKKFYVELKLINTSLEIKMSDDGKGFSMHDENKFGNGLRNMKKRVEEVKGIFEMKSKEGKGATIQLTLPLT